MNVMKIKLVMDAQKNITVTNLTSNKSFVISYSDKTVTAPNIYNILDYQLNSTYDIESNVDDITDENDKTYFLDIISLIDNIKNDINDMADTTNENQTETTETDEDTNADDDFPFSDEELGLESEKIAVTN